jgi:hypothetical protein
MADRNFQISNTYGSKREIHMIYTSLAVVVMSASSALSPLSKFVHLHQHSMRADARISVTLHNKTNSFADILIEGRTYEVPAHHSVSVKAPAGTLVFADGPNTKSHHERVVELSTAVNEKTIDVL